MLNKGLSNTTDIGLSDPKCLHQKAITKQNTHRWDDLSEPQLAHLANIANPVLEMLGYDTLEFDSKGDINDARRRYELEMIMKAKL